MITIELLNLNYAPWGLIEKYESKEGIKERPKLWLTEVCMKSQISNESITPEDLVALKKGISLGLIKVSGIDFPQDASLITQPGIRIQDVVSRTLEDIEYSQSKEGEDIYYPFVKKLVDMSVKDFKKEFKDMMKTKPPLTFLKCLRQGEVDNKNRSTILDILDLTIEKVTHSLTQVGTDDKHTGMNQVDNAYYDLIQIDLSEEDLEE